MKPRTGYHVCGENHLGLFLGDQGLEFEPMAVGKFGRSVFQAEGTVNKPHSYLIISLYEAQRCQGGGFSRVLQPGLHLLQGGHMA